jgi:hypothetical protein
VADLNVEVERAVLHTRLHHLSDRTPLSEAACVRHHPSWPLLAVSVSWMTFGLSLLSFLLNALIAFCALG